MSPGRYAVIAATLVAALLAPGTTAAQDPSTAPPSLGTAGAAILIDARDGAVMLQKNPDGRRSIASTTKLMTALLTL